MTDLAPLTTLLDGLKLYLGTDVYDFRFGGKIVTDDPALLAGRVARAADHFAALIQSRSENTEGKVLFGDPSRPGLEHVRYFSSTALPTEQIDGFVSDRSVNAAFSALVLDYRRYLAAYRNRLRVAQNTAVVRGALEGLKKSWKKKGVELEVFEQVHGETVCLIAEDGHGSVLKYVATPTVDKMLFGSDSRGATICEELHHSASPRFPTQSDPRYLAWVAFEEKLESNNS